MTKKVQNLLDFSRLSMDLLRLPPGLPKLRRFCEQVEAGETPDREFLAELATAFRAMLAEPNQKRRATVLLQALQLQKPKGRKPPAERQAARGFEAAVRVYLLAPDGKKLTAAVAMVAADLHADESTIRKWARQHRESAQPFARWVLAVERRPKK